MSSQCRGQDTDEDEARELRWGVMSVLSFIPWINWTVSCSQSLPAAGATACPCTLQTLSRGACSRPHSAAPRMSELPDRWTLVQIMQSKSWQTSHEPVHFACQQAGSQP